MSKARLYAVSRRSKEEKSMAFCRRAATLARPGQGWARLLSEMRQALLLTLISTVTAFQPLASIFCASVVQGTG